MDQEFYLTKGDFKIMRENITYTTGVTIPYSKFENATIMDIATIIDKKLN
jgi:hypothetical protein